MWCDAVRFVDVGGVCVSACFVSDRGVECVCVDVGLGWVGWVGGCECVVGFGR